MQESSAWHSILLEMQCVKLNSINLESLIYLGISFKVKPFKVINFVDRRCGTFFVQNHSTCAPGLLTLTFKSSTCELGN